MITCRCRRFSSNCLLSASTLAVSCFLFLLVIIFFSSSFYFYQAWLWVELSLRGSSVVDQR